jgi:hypothetical protein
VIDPPSIRGIRLTRVERNEADSLSTIVVHGQRDGTEHIAAIWSRMLGYWGFNDEDQQGYWRSLSDGDRAVVEAFVGEAG